MTANRGVRYAFFGVWALALTGLTYVLGATPLKVLRTWLGRPAYWAGGALLTAGLLAVPGPINQLGYAFVSLVILVGVFAELEDSGLSLTATAFFTVLISGLLGAGAFAFWIFAVGKGAWRERLLTGMEQTLKPVTDLNPALHFDLGALLWQLPSIVVILWMASLYIAVLMEARLGGRGTYRAQLAEYRNPDVVTWVLIVSLLGAFGRMAPPAIEAISNNALNVCLLLFFFQGIAVVARVLRTFRFGVGSQVLLMVVIVLHLFWFVAVIGLTDHWLDFRARLGKRSAAA